jgi:hypothetical protein
MFHGKTCLGLLAVNVQLFTIPAALQEPASRPGKVRAARLILVKKRPGSIYGFFIYVTGSQIIT